MSKIKEPFEKQILVIVKEPGQPARLEPLFENSWKAFKEALGGEVDLLKVCSDFAVIFRERGNDVCSGLPFNCRLCNLNFYGPVIAAGLNNNVVCSLKGSNVPFVLRNVFRQEGKDEDLQ